MSYRSLCRATIFAAILFAPASRAQITPVEPNQGAGPFRAERMENNFHSATLPPLRTGKNLKQIELSPVRFHKVQFVALSVSVYAASIADMHQTMHMRNYSWWYEKDPLARPLVRMPAPAYYAAGLALATGVNWISWKMGHSRGWHKLAPLPQML